MGRSVWRRASVCVTAAAVVVGVAGCQSGDGGGQKKAADRSTSRVQTRSETTEALQAVYKKTAAAKSSKVSMTMSMKGGATADSTVELTGVQGWDPAVMDVTMTGSALAAGGPEAPEKIRMIMRDNVMYTDIGEAAAANLDGKRWMKMDLTAIAESSGDPAAQKQMTKGLENMNQDPAQQLALLLESPNLKHVGPEKVDGVQTQHYKGTLSVKEMLAANKSTDGVLTPEEREKLATTIEQTGLKGYDTQVWVDEDDYPVKMVVGMTMNQGTVDLTAHYSDYGAKADVQAPPAKDTVDLVQMLKELGEESDTGLDS